ncbi:MAG: DUF3140 domain-containing protein [Armatimonadota bacterium]
MSTTAEKLDTDQVYRDFKEAVNMTASELEKYLKTEDSKRVGWKGDSGNDDASESVGHQSGVRIVKLLQTKKADLTEDDYHHMLKVVGYVHRHLKQKPDKAAEELADTNWTYSLKNWGHDPLKK